jgi:hypothetical protein
VAGHRSADRCPQPRMDALPGPRRPGPDHGRPRRHTAGRARRRPPRARSAAPSPPALKSSRRSSRRHEPRSPHRARADERHDRVPSLQHLDAPRASRPRCRSRCPAPLAVAPLVPPSTRDLIPHSHSGSARRSEPWSPGRTGGAPSDAWLRTQETRCAPPRRHGRLPFPDSTSPCCLPAGHGGRCEPPGTDRDGPRITDAPVAPSPIPAGP